MPTTNTHTYTAEMIRRYLDGKMAAAEMHELEKAALDDEFLAEAIEGLQYSGSKTNEQLADLQQRLQNKIPGKVVKLPVTSPNHSFRNIAAVFIVVATCTILYFVAFRNKENAPADNTILAKQEKTSSPQITTVPDTNHSTTAPVLKEEKNTNSGDAIQKDIALQRVPVQQKDNSLKEQQPSEDQKQNKDLKLSDRAEITTLTQDRAAGFSRTYTADSTSKLNVATSNQSLPEVKATTAALKKTRQDNSSAQAPIYNNRFSAQVMAPDNTPLPFAKINVINEQIGTYADARGRFMLVSLDTTVQVEVKVVGYVPKYIKVHANSMNEIVLEEDKNLKTTTEVMASSGTKAKSSRGRFIRDSAQNVEPADGWDLYGSYVDNNIQLPESVIENKIKGTVEISFDVKKNGGISNAKVDKSLCVDCDEEALRLIKQGPQWKVKKGRKAKSKVQVRF